jgi:hypothetical protein
MRADRHLIYLIDGKRGKTPIAGWNITWRLAT